MQAFPCGDHRSIQRALLWLTAAALDDMRWPRRCFRVIPKIGHRCREGEGEKQIAISIWQLAQLNQCRIFSASC